MIANLPPMDGFTDIRPGGWVRHLPRALIPYAILGRFDRPIGSWLLFLPGPVEYLPGSANLGAGRMAGSAVCRRCCGYARRRLRG